VWARWIAIPVVFVNLIVQFCCLPEFLRCSMVVIALIVVAAFALMVHRQDLKDDLREDM